MTTDDLLHVLAQPVCPLWGIRDPATEQWVCFPPGSRLLFATPAQAHAMAQARLWGYDPQHVTRFEEHPCAWDV